VTDWESTALCLEALDSWDRVKPYEAKIQSVIKYVLENENKWLVSPAFDTKTRTNKTLAAVTLLCNLIEITSKHFGKTFKLQNAKYFSYLSKVLDVIMESSKIDVGQYSSVHQIYYYIARMAINLDNCALNERINSSYKNNFTRLIAKLD
jgi:hypothetical protein